MGRHIMVQWYEPESSWIRYKHVLIRYKLLNGIPLKNKNRLTNFLFDEIFLQYLNFKWVQDLITTNEDFENVKHIKDFKIVLKFTIFSLDRSMTINKDNFKKVKNSEFDLTDFEFQFEFHLPKSIPEYSSEQAFPNLIEEDFNTFLTVWLSDLIAKYNSHSYYITQIEFEFNYDSSYVE